MYYRIAIQRSGDQRDRPPTWQWKSTVLSSLQTLFQLLRLYSVLPQDRLRVFFSSSRESLQEQLAQENQGFGSQSVTAAQFLQKRMIRSPEMSQGTSECETGEHRERASIAVSTRTPLNENSRASDTLDKGWMNSPERSRLEFELGPGGDHDIPYNFALPASLPQVLAWMRLLARVHRGKVQP